MKKGIMIILIAIGFLAIASVAQAQFYYSYGALPLTTYSTAYSGYSSPMLGWQQPANLIAYPFYYSGYSGWNTYGGYGGYNGYYGGVNNSSVSFPVRRPGYAPISHTSTQCVTECRTYYSY